MKTNRLTRLTLGAAAGTLALLAMAIGTATAQIPATTEYFFSSHPMISGTVLSVNDHQMVVDTDQGQRVTLELDSRTMAPRDLGPGMVMRAEFRASEDCRLYAERIMPVRPSMSTSRMQAYANTREGGTMTAAGTSARDDDRRYENSEWRTGGYGEQVSQPAGDYLPGRMMTATHTTSDFQFSNRPMISGRVLSVTDHRMVVETVQGRTVGLAMDSRTMIPREVGPGSFVRAQITTFQDGRHYAQRVSRIEEGVVAREQAYAHTRDQDVSFAATPPDCEQANTANTSMSDAEPVREVERREPVLAQYAPQPVADEPARVVDREDTLPQTASNQPLVLLFGLGALAIAGVVTAARALRIV